MSTDVTDAGFDAAVASGTVLVDFWAPWCGPCRMVSPLLDELDVEWQGRIRVLKLNIDEHPDTPAKFGVRSIPAMMVFRDGKLMDTKVGALPKASLKAWAEAL